MTIDTNGEKKPQDEVKGIEDGVLVERQVFFQDRDLKVNVANEDEKDNVATSGLQGPGVLQVHQQQQQPQGTVVYWERFLHVRSIRVLLVENDDSTQHVVSALLRNCNYEVLEAGNGLQAWKILEDLANHIDLVLTEVVMPFLSGIGLLSKIMSHKTRKNIPVIMMSSHDSMGLVFKCFSKGAVDFLVKPIRKNELKNLWQHIWRRCHSSSGSGSESGTQTQKSLKSTSSQKSDNGSDDGENNGSTGFNIGDGSDNGSGTLSSWTKRAAEVDSSQAISPMDQVAECPDITCAQVIRTNAETSGDKRVDIIVASEGHDQNQPDINANGKSLERIIPRNVKSKSENPMEIPPTLIGGKLKSLSDIDCNMTGKQIDHGELYPTGEHLFIKNKGCRTKRSETLMEGKQSGCTGEVARTLGINNNATDDSEEPNFKGSLKRLREVQDTRKSVQDDRYVLQHSEQSAFSRYNTSSNVFKARNVITRSSSIVESVEVARRESVVNIQCQPMDLLVCQNSNGNDTNIDMGSTSNELCADPLNLMDKSEARSVHNSLHPSAFRPTNDLKCTKHRLLFNDIQATGLAPVRNSQQECNIQHPHNNNYHHHHNHFHNSEQPSSNHNELYQKKVAVDVPQCRSTNILGGPIDSNHPKNYSLNRSASGSNHGSNGQNGSSDFITMTNAESDVGQAGKSGSGDGSGSGSGSSSRVDENKISQREAALNKFRQKRNERCFKKKVRYHNRKKLAEQRPRVRGQFVKQTWVETSNRIMDD